MDTASLKKFLDELVQREEFKPRDGKTYCNLASKEVARFFGCKDFEVPNLLADGMYHLLASNLSGAWSKIDYEFASNQAQRGELVFAALPSWVLGGNHGHICALYPAAMQHSGSLGHAVPMVANVGRAESHGIVKTSGAFPVKLGMPHFYLWVKGAVKPYLG